MRILSLDYECNVHGATTPLKGGTARFARDFSQAVVESGHTWLGVLQRRDLRDSPWKCIEESSGKEFYAIASRDVRIEDVAALNSLTEIEERYRPELDALCSAIQHLHPDVVFLNGFSQYSWLLYRAAKEEGVPIAIQHAGLWVRDLEALASLLPPNYQQLAKEMEYDATVGASASIFLNEYSKEVLTQELQLPDMPTSHIIPLPHAGWEFSPVCTPTTIPEKRIAIVARWDRIKNHDAVLAFAEEVKRRALPWKILSVTSIPDTPARAEFKNRYRELIEVLPPMPRDDLYEFFKTLDAAILPSLFETAGGVVMEAAAAGVPTLISPTVGWVSEYETVGMGDWIVDFSNPQTAVDVLVSQFTRTEWAEFCDFARYIEENHDPKRVFAAYLSLFTRISSNAN